MIIPVQTAWLLFSALCYYFWLLALALIPCVNESVLTKLTAKGVLREVKGTDACQAVEANEAFKNPQCLTTTTHIKNPILSLNHNSVESKHTDIMPILFSLV